jgi:hypothetical protein
LSDWALTIVGVVMIVAGAIALFDLLRVLLSAIGGTIGFLFDRWMLKRRISRLDQQKLA